MTKRINLSQVCRKLSAKQYKTREEVQIDMYRMFHNCVQYYSRRSRAGIDQDWITRVSHYREYFECLWLEFMVPISPPLGASAAGAFATELDFRQREVLRSARLSAIANVQVSCSAALHPLAPHCSPPILLRRAR